MAAKTNIKDEIEENKPFYRRIWCMSAVLLLVSFLYYTWTKICQIIRDSQTSPNEGWWIIKRLTGDQQTSLSFTESEFYWLLVGVMKDDIVWVIHDIFDIKQYIPDWKYIFMIVTTVSAVGAGFYYYYNHYSANVNSEREPIKKEKNQGYTKAQPHYGKHHKPTSGGKLHRLASYSPTRKYYWRWLTGILFFAFLLSIPWEYVRLYQLMVAEKVTQMTTSIFISKNRRENIRFRRWYTVHKHIFVVHLPGIPPECVPDQMSMTQSLRSWLRVQFSWSADPCLQYHKALLVDPMWQVSPLMVITSAMSHCLLYPVEFFFSGMGKAMRLFFTEIPVQWQPFMFIVFIIFLLLLMIMLFGYRIRCPLISIEPKKSLTSYLAQKQLEKIMKNNGDLSIDSSLDYSITSSLETQDSQDSQYK